jgi:hypothetical protein
MAFTSVDGLSGRTQLVVDFLGTCGGPDLEVLSHVAEAVRNRPVPGNPDNFAQCCCLSLEIVLLNHEIPTQFHTP